MNFRFIKRPAMGSIPLSLLVAVYILCLLNLTFWNEAFYVFGGFHLGFYTFAAAMTLLVFAGMVIFSVKYLIKPFLVFLLIAGAMSSYYTDFFGVVIDKEMIRNAVVTTPAEAGPLITLTFVLHVLFYGVLPSVLVCLVRIRHRPFIGKFFVNLAVISLCLTLCIGLIVSNYSGISSNIREHRDMMAKLTPFAAITSAIGLGVSAYRDIGLVRLRSERMPNSARSWRRRKTSRYHYRRWRNGTGDELLPERVQPGDQSGTQGSGRDQLYQHGELRNSDGGVIALHVFRL